MSTAPAPPPSGSPSHEVALDDTGHLAEDVACRHCGYNLRGQTLEGTCPECDTPVGKSVQGDLLRYCDPTWVEHLAGGMRLFAIAIIAGIVGGAGVGVFVAISAFITGAVPVPLLLVFVAVTVGVTGLQLVAYWKVTMPDPGRDESEHPWTPRAIARWALVASAAFGIVSNLLDQQNLGGLIMPIPAGLGVLVKLFGLVVLVVALFGTAMLFVYARSLALRLPDDKLAQQTRLVMWGYLIASGAMQGMTTVQAALVQGAPNSSVAQVVVALATLVTLIPGLVFWIWGVVLVFKYRGRFIATAQQARATWAGETASSSVGIPSDE